MSTSNVYSFNQTRDEIILDTLIGMNVIGSNETSIPAEDLSFASRALNRIIKRWAAKDLPLWSRKEGILFFQYGQSSYDVGPSSSDSITNSYVDTTTSAAASSAATSIVVTSATGLVIGQNIGILLDTGYLQWTTITNIVSTTITLNNALTEDVESGAVVYACTLDIQRPMRIIDGRVYDINSEQDIPITQINYIPYMHQSIKTAVGSFPTQYAYNPLLDMGKLYFYQTPAVLTKVFKFTYHNPIQDFNISTDNPDFPVQWLDALMAELAYQLAPKYSMYAESGELKARAQAAYADALISNHEEGNIDIKFDNLGN